MEQRTQEWFDARKMKFTASRINELLGVKGLGLTGESYARDVAQEYFFDKEEMFVSNDMQRGIDLEPMAFDFIKQKFEKDFVSVENCGFFTVGEMGASPDGLIGDDAILEIKCPYNSGIHLKNFNIYDADSLKQTHPEYYWQMQLGMIAANLDYGYFVSYDPRMPQGKQMHIAEIERHEVEFELNEKLENAWELLQNILAN